MNQDKAFELMKSGENIFLTGRAGVGKSHLLNKYIQYCYENGIAIAITASTGIAATHIGGTTIHSWSGINIYNNDDNPLMPAALQKICTNPNRMDNILDTQVLIIDEISMLQGFQLDWVNTICKKIRENPQPFGGIQVIVTGDFLQLPPVVRNNSISVQYAYDSNAWEEAEFKVCYLTKIFRQTDENFLSLLNNLRKGIYIKEDYQILRECLHKSISVKTPTELYPLNIDVEHINNNKLSLIKKSPVTYKMSTAGNPKEIVSLIKGCLSPEVLVLKEGAIVMFTRNNYKEDYRNGTFGEVVGFSDDLRRPIVKLLTGRTIVVDQAKWELEQWNAKKKRYEVTACISQFPLKLGWAISIYKGQGITLDAVKIALSDLFAYNMGYVALSRVKSLENLTLTSLDKSIYYTDAKLIRKDQEFQNNNYKG